MYIFFSKSLSILIKAKPIYTVIVFVFSLISTACNLALTIFTLQILAIAFNEQFFLESKLLSAGGQILNSFETEEIIILVSWLFVIIVLKNIANYFATVIGLWQIKSLVNCLTTQKIANIAGANFNYYRRHNTEDILLRLNSEIEQIALTVASIQKMLITAVKIAIVTAILLVISWQLALISLIILMFILMSIMAINNWFSSQANKVKIASLKATQSSNRQIAGFLRGIYSIEAIANQPKASVVIAKSLQKRGKIQFVAQLMSATVKPLIEISGAALVLITIVSYYLYAGAISTSPILLVYLTILFWLLHLVSQFNIARLEYINRHPTPEVMSDFFASEKAIAQKGNLILTQVTKGITFKAVTFAPVDRTSIIFDRIDLELPAQKTTALMGLPPGSSFAVVDLLRRLDKPTKGTILLDDQELVLYSKDLNKAIAVVSHDTFLFNNSLAENIAYGVDGASEADIIDAAKKAHLYKFIKQLPAKFATQVGEAGITLPSLQKLQIGLARAFLRNPKIIVLDEPFNNIEGNLIAIKFMQKTLQLLCRDRTTIMITQQPQLAQTADSIVVFRQGKIVETGTHQQLLQQGNIYPRLHSMQFKTNQQSRQLKLAQKIARKLAQKNNSSLAQEIRTNLDSLLNSIEILNQGWFNNDLQEEKILDESFHSAKNMLANLKKYKRRLDEQNDENNY